MLTSGRLAILTLAVAVMTACAAADAPKDAPNKPVSVGGLYTGSDSGGKGQSAMIWTDGEDAPAKYAFDPSCDKSNMAKMTPTGIFGPIRVQITYVSDADGARKLMSIRRTSPPGNGGSVKGEVLFIADNFFWIAVKPKNGPLDGFAIGRPDKQAGDTIKKLQKGDWVAIQYHTDFERHRIDALEVVPKPPDPAAKPAVPPAKPPSAAAAPPTTDTATPTSQPVQTEEQKAQAKLKLAEIYLGNGLTDKAKAMLRDVVKLYPGTNTAQEAQKKLTDLGE